MTDELLLRRLRIGWHDDDTPIWVSDAMTEAADRIEQLTAERDAAYAQGYSDAETEISKSALGQRNYFLHSQYENATDHIKVLTTERDRLREALERIAGVKGPYSHPFPESNEGYGSFAIVTAREALKGESHE